MSDKEEEQVSDQESSDGFGYDYYEIVLLILGYQRSEICLVCSEENNPQCITGK